MKLGFFTMPIHPLDKDWRKSLREDREAFILADKLGFTEGYVGEHATDKAENITSCAVFIASLINATKKIKLGTGTINMPNSHPAATAATCCEMPDCVAFSRIAARVNEPSSTTAIIAWICRSAISAIRNPDA